MENALDLVVPMVERPAKAAESFKKEPIFARLRVGATGGGLEDGSLVGRKVALAEGIFAVALPESAALFDGKACQETE